MNLQFISLYGKWRVIEDSYVEFNQKNIKDDLIKRGVRQHPLNDNLFFMPKETIITITNIHESPYHCHVSINFYKCDNKDNPWAGFNRGNGFDTLKDFQVEVEEVVK